MLRFCLAGSYPLDESRIGGGVEHAVFTLAQTFRERDDIDFHVVAPHKGLDGVRVVEAPGMTVHYVGVPSRKLVPNLLTTAARVAPMLKRLSPDVVNSHHAVTTLAAARAQFKVVHTLHGIAHREIRYCAGADKMSCALVSLLVTRACRRADAVTGVAQYALDSYRRFISVPSYVVPLPLEDLFWDLAPSANPRGLLFAGGIGLRKNLLILVQAMPAILDAYPDVVLNVCGGITDKVYHQTITRCIADNGIGSSVVFHGVVDRGTLVQMLGDSVALVIPSRQETTPTVICQAMAAGRVAIASRVGAISEMIEDGVTGYVIDPDDHATLARRVIELLDDPGKRDAITAAARVVAGQRYERHLVADQMLRICRLTAAEDGVR